MSSVIIIKDSFDDLAKALSFIALSRKKVCIVTDDNVSKLYLGAVLKSVEALENRGFSFSVKPGERSKDLTTVCSLYDFLIENKFGRDDAVVALGGGVVGDIAGYTASTFKRGLAFIQIPTTLLAQVDSAIGGKNGIDYKGVKNAIGTFCRPRLIYVNKTVLSSLPEEEIANGKAELIKTGIISSNSFEPEIDDCIRFKKQITDEDPYDEGRRQILNFGHTIGHAIEAASDYSLKHGACVSLGMICACEISAGRGMIGPEKTDELRSVLAGYGLPVKIRDIDHDRIVDLCANDKKVRDGKSRFILLNGFGDPVIAEDVSEKEIRTALETINE